LIVGGCGAKTGTVSGKVTYKGEPVPGGFINFLPQTGPDQGRVFSSTIDESGSYQVAGVPVGPVKIIIQDPGGRPPMNKPKEKKAPPRKYPKRYGTLEGSDLTYAVVGGSQQHDVKLK
jgi:hypothetical protein